MEPTENDVRRILEQARTVAVIGAHPKPEKPAHFVPAYLLEQGYRVLPINGRYTGQRLFGHDAPCTLAHADDLREQVDVVCVFRRSEAVPEHLDEILGMGPPPKVVWLQKGIRNEAVAEILRAKEIFVVQDKCMLAEHRDLGIAPIAV